jgi:hypothetical protein
MARDESAHRARRPFVTAAIGIAAAAALGGLLSACDGGDGHSSGIKTAVAAAPSTTAPSRFHGELSPGTYETEVFTPRLRLTVGSGWSVRFALKAGIHFDVDNRDAPGVDITNENADVPVDEAVASYRLPTMWKTIGPVVDSTAFGKGAGGKQFDVVADDLGSTPIGVYGQGVLKVSPNDTLRLCVANVAGKTLLVSVASHPAEFTSAVSKVEPVLMSIAAA